MHEEKKDNELEELFASFDKQFAECEKKFNDIEQNLKSVRADQDDPLDTQPGTAE